MANVDLPILVQSFFAGTIPALVWLLFWLREDKKNPEPPRLLVAAFVAGTLAVIPALLLEQAVSEILPRGIFLIVIWAIIEEVLKYGAAYFVAFRKFCLGQNVCLDEPIDPLIYMITASIGFAGIENALFLLTPLGTGDLGDILLTGNLRFIGAMVLHVVASSSIGIAMGLSFFKNARLKHIYLWVGICTAALLHTLFNAFIIINKGENIFVIFSALWATAIVILYLFEKIKKMYAVPK